MAANNKINELNLIKLNLFKEQNLENGFFDVGFEVEGKVIFAHKPMLNLVSPTFASMLADRWMKDKDAPIKIKDYSYDNFYQFLTFLYSGECQLTETNISSMVDIAEFYGIELFKNYCEQYLFSMKIKTENIFQLMDLANKYSMVQFKSCLYGFIADNFKIDSAALLNLSKDGLTELIDGVKDKIKHDDLFQVVYKWTENQALNKQLVDSNLNLQDAIKAEFTDFLPHINFRRIELKFLVEFVVARGFIFSSFNELSKILSDRLSQRVKVTNALGQTLSGNLAISDESIIKSIQSLGLTTEVSSPVRACWWKKPCKIPSTPSPLKKRDGIEWYLLMFPSSGNFAVVRRNVVVGSEYLIAEMTGDDAPDFQASTGCKIEIE